MRIAMTVVQKGADDGILGTVTQRNGPEFRRTERRIGAGSGEDYSVAQHRR